MSGRSPKTPHGRRVSPRAGSAYAGQVALGRRLAALAIDWAFSLLIATGLLQPLRWGSFAPLAVFLAIHVVLVATAGFTPGQAIMRLRVVRTSDGGPPGPVRAMIRSVLLCLVLPALVRDGEQRGLHDRAAGTTVVRR